MIRLGFLLIILLLNNFSSSSQEELRVFGKVADSAEGRPLFGAHVYLKDQSVGTTTDLSGDFSINLRVSRSDTLVVSFLGYITEFLVLDQYNSTNGLEIFLDPNPQVLESVIVTPSAPLVNAKDLFAEIIGMYNQNKRTSPHIAHSYYSEWASIDDEFVSYTDALGYSIYGGKEVDWAPLGLYQFYPKNMRKSDRKDGWLELFRINHQTGKTYNEVFYGGSNSLNAFQHLTLRGVLSMSNVKKYSMKMDTIERSSYRNTGRIHFKGNREKGYLDFDFESLQISRIHCRGKHLWSIPFNKRISGDIDVHFSYFNYRPYVNKVEIHYAKDGLEYWNEFKVLLQKFDEFEISKNDIGMLNVVDPFVNYDADEWISYNSIIKDLQFVQSDLTDKVPLTIQFSKNSNQQYMGGEKTKRSKERELLIQRLDLIF